ncbi:acyl-CoA dehydrogenase family protein [Kitasatospora sp. NPDC054939]
MTSDPYRRVSPVRPQASPCRPAITAELTRLLYGSDHGTVHRNWRARAADPLLHRPAEGTVEQRIASSYERLRRVNASVDPVAVVTDPRQLAALHEWLTPVDGAMTLAAGVHYNLFLGSLLDQDAPGRLPLDDYLRMERIGTFLCTELAHGNDAQALETVAVYDRTDRTFTLHTPNPGARKFMPNTGPAGGPKSAVVAARLLVDGRDQGIFLFLVPLTDARGTLPGIGVHPLPLRPGTPVDHCLTSFDHVVLPHEAMLTGRHGHLADDGTVTSALGSKRKRFLTAIGRVTTGKLCMSAVAVGNARTALATAVRYAHHRHVTGSRADRQVPVWSHRTHHGPLLDALATTYAMTALHRTALAQWVGHDTTDPDAVAAAELQVALAKGWTTWRAREVIAECRERCGAQGLLPVNGLVTLAADVEGSITAEGDNVALWAKTGAELLLQAEPEARPTDLDGPLGSPATRQALLHSAHQLALAAARTRLRAAPAGDSQRRWNSAAPDALAAATARAETTAATALLAWAHSAQDPTARSLLLDLHLLFTLRRLEGHAVLLLTAGALTPEQLRDLPDLREQAIARLAEHGLTLVDAFDLPEAFLARYPIAGPAYQEAFTAPEVAAAPAVLVPTTPAVAARPAVPARPAVATAPVLPVSPSLPTSTALTVSATLPAVGIAPAAPAA